MENTLGFWYPDTIIDGYNEDNGYNTETSYFAAKCEIPAIDDSKITVIRDFYYRISRSTMIQKIPVISMAFSVGTMSWVFLICIWYNIYKKRKNILCMLSLLLFIWLTLLIGPMVLVRYMLIFYFAFPLMLAFMFNGDKI